MENGNMTSSESVVNTTANNVGNCSKKLLCYIYSPQYVKVCDILIKVKSRASIVHALIEAYGLTEHLNIISPRPAAVNDLTTFHNLDYVQYLKNLNEAEEEDYEKYESNFEEYGLGYDCLPFPGVYTFAAFMSGGTLTAASALLDNLCNIAINWCGGWHHARKDEASGYCFFNDCILAILKLRQRFERVLYIDFDLHHGDGVEEAFCFTDKVMTISFHHLHTGFFPGTGRLSEIGHGQGRYYSINVPLKEGITNAPFIQIFHKIIAKVKDVFDPQVLVCQCGADGIVGDPMSVFNLTHHALGACIETLLQWHLPMLVLGGGGYNNANTARCWTYITSLLLQQKLSSDIPDNEFFDLYGPHFELDISPSHRKDYNEKPYLDYVTNSIIANLENLCKKISLKI